MIEHNSQRPQNNLNVAKRAAEVRHNWSTKERLKRLGLPPDMPPRLQAYLIGRPDHKW